MIIEHISSINNAPCPQCHGEISFEKIISLNALLKVRLPDTYIKIVKEEKELIKRIQNDTLSTKINKIVEILQTIKKPEKTIILPGS